MKIKDQLMNDENESSLLLITIMKTVNLIVMVQKPAELQENLKVHLRYTVHY